jgi:hypothetical protein
MSHAEKAKSVVETEVYSCMASFLSSEKMLDHRFRFKSDAVLNETECASHLDDYRNGFYHEISNELRNDEDLVENADCLLSQLKKLFLAETSMKKIIYENSRKMSRRKRKKALRAINYAIEKKMETAVMLCTTEEVFGELFDVLYSSGNETESSENENDEDKQGEDYCHRKYIVEKNFINTTVYDVTLNPENINTSDLNCDEIIELSIEEAENELKSDFLSSLDRSSRRKGRCIGKTIRTHNFFEHSMRVIMLGEIGIPDHQRAEERSNFIREMKDLYEAIMNC